MRILIGYDGSKHCNAALDDLRLAGLPSDTKSLVVSVADPSIARGSIREVFAMAMPSRFGKSTTEVQQTHSGQLIEADEFAMKAADRLLIEFPEWEVAKKTRMGPAATELIDAAKDWNADLMVVGSERVPVAEEFLIRSQGEPIDGRSNTSVRVSRPNERKNPDSPPKILVGIDGSPAAQEAVYEIGRRTWMDGTQVQMIAVQTPTLVASQSESMLTWARYHLRSVGLNPSMSIQGGDPTRILIRDARMSNADCIFLGAGTRENQIGSVSRAVLNKAHCSVEVVRPVE
ncbi:MAG TPA: universal stress protein [Pyrinomonadaceae bacterium]|nr:universal stress protein [Pyrinomonadaceae bacterium]